MIQGTSTYTATGALQRAATQVRRAAALTIAQTGPNGAQGAQASAGAHPTAPAVTPDHTANLAVSQDLSSLAVTRLRAMAAYEANARAVEVTDTLHETLLTLVA